MVLLLKLEITIQKLTKLEQNLIDLKQDNCLVMRIIEGHPKQS